MIVVIFFIFILILLLIKNLDNIKLFNKIYPGFSFVQKEDKRFKNKREQITQKFNKKQLLFYSNKIDELYKEKYGVFGHCPLNEINYLKEKRKLYSKHSYNIKFESMLSTNHIIRLFTDDTNKINKYTYYLNNVLDPILYHLKNKYDRIRPQFCEENLRLKESIERIHLPNHAAYPSGHAATVYFLYYMEPTKRNMEIADRIAINREIATLHYPSDTHFGKFIGYSMVNIIKSTL